MPRQARLDTPGLLHHIISRGLERRKLFQTTSDYNDFLHRIEISLRKSPNQVLAWALMPNHFHLLIRSGSGGITQFMRRLMSGYAISFNARHKRAGHLFQNRYKSIICEEAAYLKELVRYIHLNPLRAGIVADMKGLKKYPFSGHSVLMGTADYSWQEQKDVLALFGKTKKIARARYAAYIREGIKAGKRPDLTGGGLKRSHKGQWPEKTAPQIYDSRILGDSDFVEEVLREEEKLEQQTKEMRKKGWQGFVNKVAKVQGIEKERLFQKGRSKAVSDGKAMLIYAGVMHFGKKNKAMANMTCMSEPSASRAKERGKIIMRRLRLDVS